MKWLKPVLVLSTLCVLAPIPGHAGDAMIVNPDQMKWSPVPAVPRTEWAILSGDLNKKGPFVFELRGPAGTKIPPHWHSNMHVGLCGSCRVGVVDDAEGAKQRGVARGRGGGRRRFEPVATRGSGIESPYVAHERAEPYQQ